MTPEQIEEEWEKVYSRSSKAKNKGQENKYVSVPAKLILAINEERRKVNEFTLGKIKPLSICMRMNCASIQYAGPFDQNCKLCSDEWNNILMRLRKAETALCRARGLLEEYGMHGQFCGFTFDQSTQAGELGPCTCGLDEALSSTSPCRHEEEVKELKRTLEIQIRYHAKLDAQKNERIRELEGEVENGRHWLCCAVMYAGGEITIKDDLSDKAKDYEVMAQPNIDDGLLRVFVRRKAKGG
jgi:hypothetical protein